MRRSNVSARLALLLAVCVSACVHRIPANGDLWAISGTPKFVSEDNCENAIGQGLLVLPADNTAPLRPYQPPAGSWGDPGDKYVGKVLAGGYKCAFASVLVVRTANYPDHITTKGEVVSLAVLAANNGPESKSEPLYYQAEVTANGQKAITFPMVIVHSRTAATPLGVNRQVFFGVWAKNPWGPLITWCRVGNTMPKLCKYEQTYLDCNFANPAGTNCAPG